MHATRAGAGARMFGRQGCIGRSVETLFPADAPHPRSGPPRRAARSPAHGSEVGTSATKAWAPSGSTHARVTSPHALSEPCARLHAMPQHLHIQLACAPADHMETSGGSDHEPMQGIGDSRSEEAGLSLATTTLAGEHGSGEESADNEVRLIASRGG